MTKGSRIFYIGAMSGIGLTTVFLGYVFLLLFFPSKVIDIKMPIDTIPKGVRGGDSVHIDASYCKYKSAATTITRSINSVDKENVVVPLPVLASNPQVGCGSLFIDAQIPEDIPRGKYRLVFAVQYQANPVRNITQEFETEVFTVYK